MQFTYNNYSYLVKQHTLGKQHNSCFLFEFRNTIVL